MKKLFLLAMIALASVGINAQTVKGEGSLMGNIGYQTNYERFGLGVQGRYAIANNLRIAPDVTFYFPKDKVTGLDVSVNFHYVFNFKEDGQGFSVYPLAGIGMQNNFYGKKSVEIDGKEMELYQIRFQLGRRYHITHLRTELSECRSQVYVCQR